MVLHRVTGNKRSGQPHSRPWWIVSPRRICELIPFNLPIITRSPLTPPKGTTLEQATVVVRSATAQSMDFEKCHVGKSETHFPPEFGLKNRRIRMKESAQMLRFYQVLQRELLDPRNGNQVQRYAPRRLTPPRTTNAPKCQRDTEHARHCQGSRHLAKTAAETAAP